MKNAAILFSLFLLFLFVPLRAQAAPLAAENLGPIYPRPEEELYLLKILSEGFLADHVHYAAADKQGNIVAMTPEVGRLTHRLECTPNEGCLLYNLWQGEIALWDFKTGLPLQERKSLFSKNQDKETAEYRQDWVDFINRGKGARIETLFLQDMLDKPFGVFQRALAQNVHANFFAACVIMFLMLASYYGAVRAWTTKNIALQALSFAAYGLSFIFACALMDMAFTITPFHFGALILASAFGFYRLGNRRPKTT